MMQLFKTDQGWFIRDTDQEVRRLFGTDVLPTGFTAQCPESTVVAELTRLNPGRRIVVGSTSR